MHPHMTTDLASQHRHEMTVKASHHAQAAHASETAGARQAAASPRGPRRGGARRAYLRGALLPRYRVSWSRTALSTAAADGARRGRSWVIVISATRGL